MGLEMELKITRVLYDFMAPGLIAKDREGPVFTLGETESMFTLTSHLKGYKKENIKIDINKDGTLMAISRKKKVQMLVLGREEYKKKKETRGFRKTFKIPAGVILDKINAKFNKDDSLLTITMPKSVKGLTGIIIDELALPSEGSGAVQIIGDKVTEKGKKLPEADEKGKGYENLDPGKEVAGSKAPNQEETQVEVHDLKKQTNTDEKEVKSGKQKKGLQELDIGSEQSHKEIHQAESSRKNQSVDQDEHKDNHVVSGKEVYGIENEIKKKANDVQVAGEGKFSGDKEYINVKSTQTEKAPEKNSKISVPVLAGSALLVSVVVFVIYVIRDKSRGSKKQ